MVRAGHFPARGRAIDRSIARCRSRVGVTQQAAHGAQTGWKARRSDATRHKSSCACRAEPRERSCGRRDQPRQLGSRLADQGNYAKATLLYQRALEIWEKSSAPTIRRLPSSLMWLGVTPRRATLRRPYHSKNAPSLSSKNLEAQNTRMSRPASTIWHSRTESNARTPRRSRSINARYAIREKTFGPEHQEVATEPVRSGRHVFRSGQVR